MTTSIYSRITDNYGNVLPAARATRSEIAAWRATVPALAELTEPTDLDRLVAADPDTVLGALLDLHQDGSQLAAAMLLHQMLPVLCRLTKYAHDCSPAARADDRSAAVIAAFLNVIAIHRGRSKIAGALRMKTLGVITAQPRPAEVLGDELLFDLLDGRTGHRTREPGAPRRSRGLLIGADVTHGHDDPADRVSARTRVDYARFGVPHPDHATGAAVLTWARCTEVITADEQRLLARTYLEDEATTAEIAAELGVSYPALRKRLQRLVARIRNEVLHAQTDIDFTRTSTPTAAAA